MRFRLLFIFSGVGDKAFEVGAFACEINAHVIERKRREHRVDAKRFGDVRAVGQTRFFERNGRRIVVEVRRHDCFFIAFNCGLIQSVFG